MPSTPRVAGVCDPAFKAVHEALEQNLADGKEIGECVAVVVNGKTVVDLWGGYKDRARTQPWSAIRSYACSRSESRSPSCRCWASPTGVGLTLTSPSAATGRSLAKQEKSILRSAR